MFTAYIFHKWALRDEQQARKREQERQEGQQRLEELTIQRLVAERQLHDAQRLRYEAEYKLLALKAQRRRRKRRRRSPR